MEMVIHLSRRGLVVETTGRACGWARVAPTHITISAGGATVRREASTVDGPQGRAGMPMSYQGRGLALR
jgi:hypothetical protein